MARRDDEVFDGLVALVATGEYLDRIEGIPGLALDGGGTFVGTGENQRRLYRRGSADLAEAKAAGLVAPMPSPPYAPVGEAEVAAVEELLGHPVPPMLRRIYRELSNGGFGPAYGMLGLTGGHAVAPQGNAIERRQVWADEGARIPAPLLEVCDWGCGISSFVDCADGGRMWALDPNPVDDLNDGLFAEDLDITEWFARWLDRTLQQPWNDPDASLEPRP